MAASPSSVLTQGLGVWGTPSLLVTLGFGSGVAPTTAAITGTVLGATEANIVTGGKTIIITLTNDTWVSSGAAFNAQRQNIINGLDSAQAEALGWDAVVKATQAVSGVVRTSNTVVTITLDAFPTYNITASETITVTVPASALATSLIAVVASPTFSVTPISVSTTPEGIGNWYKSPRKKKKPIRLRLNDYATTEDRIRALAQALADASEPIEAIQVSGDANTLDAANAKNGGAEYSEAEDSDLDDDESLLLVACRLVIH